MRKILAVLATSTLLLSGCTTNAGLTKNAQNGTGVSRISPTKRTEPITISGYSLQGQKLSTKALDGIVVVNAWASWCRTCILEWRDLQDVSKVNPDVSFLGLNESDSKQEALKFLSSHQTNYGHIFDPDNAILNSIQGLPSLAIPTTIVLDKKHRIAARIMGQVHGGDLKDIISKLRAE